MIFNMIGSGGSSDKSTIIVRTETNSTVGIYTDDSYSTLIKEATYKGLSSYVTISNQESSCPNYSNYWYFERYNTLSANTMEACDAATPVDARYYADSTISTSMNIADSYTARATTYVYSPIDQTLSISCTTDDDGTVYLNDTVLTTLTSTKAKTVSFPLVAGINKITIIYTEGTGADGWVTNPLFSVNNNITAMWGTYEPMTITIDKTQLASKLGVTSRYCNFIYNGIDWTLDGNTINLSEYGITYAATNTIGMYINFVYKYNIYGEYWLQNLNNGIYYLKATKDTNTSTLTYTITEYGAYRITMSYTTVPTFSYVGGSYEIVEDDDTVITNPSYQGNWKIRFLSSGTLNFTRLGSAENGIDLFLVGGGGGAGGNNNTTIAAGGGGGYTGSYGGIAVSTGIDYPIVVGAGGTGVLALGNDGGSSSAFGYNKEGGKGGAAVASSSQSSNSKGGDGGSGGAGSFWQKQYVGGSDGGDGTADNAARKGLGQGTSTREFYALDQDITAKLYAGGGANRANSTYGTAGAGGGGANSNGEDNLGGGAGGGNCYSGGSGIVIIRNARS